MGFTVRTIKEDDLENMMNWRMSPDVTRFMFTDPKLTLEGQRKWYESVKDRADQRRWIVEVDHIPAGTIHLEEINYDDKCATWGYYIGEKSLRSFQLAISLELSLYDYVFEKMNFEKLHSEMFSFNSGVIKLHELCGCRIDRLGKVEKNGTEHDVTYMSISRKEWESGKGKCQYEKIDFS